MAGSALDILVVDDDAPLRDMLTRSFEREGHRITSVADGHAALEEAGRGQFDVILLDVALGPGPTGYDVARALRARRNVTPLIMLTALDSEADAVQGLEAGADDYVTKPFKPVELVARVRAQLRRGETTQAETLSIGDVQIDVPAHQVTRDGVPISLTPLEFDLLVALARKPRQVFTRELLLEQVWGYRHAADTRLVNVHVQRLRAKIERDPEKPEVVLTVRGVGYKAGPP
ncbi:MAG TPA: MtrAB system response regulator MtrA [Gaiellales bacterium]|nr:MtrAB system response regulator MtrA [Gaiellales bacterium]